MTREFPAQDLDCPDPAGCAVARGQLTTLASTGMLQTVIFEADKPWCRVYDAQSGLSEPNPGFGDTRFAPFDSLSASLRVPTLYLAETLEAALLETCLHDVHLQRPRIVAERSLLGKLHARMTPSKPLELVDLRDGQLTSLGLSREHLASSPSEHYPCTRFIAQAIHHSYPRSDGILWHSRQAELAELKPQEVVVLFADRVPASRDTWTLSNSKNASGALLEGSGRLLLDELAEKLDITISISDDLHE